MVWPPNSHGDVQDKINEITFPDCYRSGHYSLGHFTGLGTSSTPIGAGVAYARPFIVFATRTFDRIGVNVTAAATASSGGTIQTALYGPGPLPGTLLVATTAVSSETTGAKEWVISQTLTPGVYWVAVRTVTATCSIPTVNSAEHNSPFVSAGTTVPSATNSGGYTVSTPSATVAGFPSPFNVDQATPNIVSASPLVVLRAA